MASTKELVTYILDNDQEIRDWFETEHRFTREKAENADLTLYRDLVAGVLQEGMRKNLVSQAQVDGREKL